MTDYGEYGGRFNTRRGPNGGGSQHGHHGGGRSYETSGGQDGRIFPGGGSQRGHHSGGTSYETPGGQDGRWPSQGRGRGRGRGRGGGGGGGGGGRGGGGGHPPHLTGKAIGLFYRDLQKKKEADSPKRSMKLDPETQETVERMLENSKRPCKWWPESTETFDHKAGIRSRYINIEDSQFKREFMEIVSGDIQRNLSKALQIESKLRRNIRLDEKLLEELRERQSTRGYANMLEFRSKLPSFGMRQEILDLLDDNQVVVISGETGCGKTTQVAQFILDEAIERGDGSITKIICTQPRRISAVSVAERVAAERVEPLGKSVGYQIRLEKVPSRDCGSILFCTTGLLLQYMQTDPALRDFSHIILDEIHERNTETDFIITLLKQIIPKRPNLKVVLMSATLNSDRFSSYYGDCPNIHIPGFTYPVTDYYLEDVLQMTRFKFPMAPSDNYPNSIGTAGFPRQIWTAIRQLELEEKYPWYVTTELKRQVSETLSLELIQALLEYICAERGPGAILVFLPGMLDITKLTQLLLESGSFPPHRAAIYPLHSRMPTVEQKLIFKPPPNGIRKIIIATSIAETSITIEDVVYVIDCGRMKLARFDIGKNIETLEPEWISLANAKQRRGRAGRVQPGECYHLFTRARESLLEEYPAPEMLRTPLEQVILQTKILQLGKVETFLSRVMDPPEPRAIELSLDLLRSLNAIDANENLTPLGYHLAKLPLHPRIGKMLIYAALFSCVDPVLSIAATLEFKDPFYCPFGMENEAYMMKLKLGQGEHSDHIALAEALRQYEQNYAHGTARKFCNIYFLSQNTLKLLSGMKHQFARHLCEMKFLDSDDPADSCANLNSKNLAMIKAIVCAGFYPNIATDTNFNTGKRLSIVTGGDGRVRIHPGSINARVAFTPTPYFTYFLKQRSKAIYLHDTTNVSWVAVLFAAPKCTMDIQDRECNIVLKDSVTIRCETKTARLIQRLRQEMESLLEYKIAHPGTIKWNSPEGLILQAIATTVSQGYPARDSSFQDGGC